MATRKETQAKIAAAEDASSEALAARRAAIAKLNGSVSTNGYGIVHDPVELEVKLLGALKHIEDALKCLAGVNWPTDAEYNQSEENDA